MNIQVGGKWYGDRRVTSDLMPFCLDHDTYYAINNSSELLTMHLNHRSADR
jgi:hypothetical protein